MASISLIGGRQLTAWHCASENTEDETVITVTSLFALLIH